MSVHKGSLLASKVARAKLGIDIKSLGTLMVEQALAARIRKTQLSEDVYLRVLETNDIEQENFCQLLLVSESWFEREQQPIECALKALQNNFSQIGVLSVPCARGEEAITTLAVAMRLGIMPSQVSIEGYDASETAVAQAKLFLYGEYSFRGTSEWFRNSFFSKTGEGYHLNPELRSSFHFSTANLLDPFWKPLRSQFELILCRNLLIYLRPRVRHQLLTKLSTLLHPKGLIVTTYSEASLLLEVGFQKERISTAIFSPIPKQELLAPLKLAKTTKIGPSKRNVVRTPTQSTVTRSASELASPNASRKFESRSPDITDDIRFLADTGRLDEAFSLGLELLEARPNDAQSHFLLGVIASSCGQIEQARSWIERALLLDPQHEDAKIYLSNVWGEAVK